MNRVRLLSFEEREDLQPLPDEVYAGNGDWHLHPYFCDRDQRLEEFIDLVDRFADDPEYIKNRLHRIKDTSSVFGEYDPDIFDSPYDRSLGLWKTCRTFKCALRVFSCLSPTYVSSDISGKIDGAINYGPFNLYKEFLVDNFNPDHPIKVDPNSWYIPVVLAGKTGKGIGSTLIHRLKTDAHQEGDINCIYAHAWGGGYPEFFIKHGFRIKDVCEGIAGDEILSFLMEFKMSDFCPDVCGEGDL